MGHLCFSKPNYYQFWLTCFRVALTGTPANSAKFLIAVLYVIDITGLFCMSKLYTWKWWFEENSNALPGLCVVCTIMFSISISFCKCFSIYYLLLTLWTSNYFSPNSCRRQINFQHATARLLDAELIFANLPPGPELFFELGKRRDPREL